MSRLPQPAQDADERIAAVYQAILASRGQVSPLYQTLLNSPVAARAWEAFLVVVRRELSIPARLRELVILRIAVLNGADYEFEAHRHHAEASGLSGVEIDALRDGADNVFAGTDALVIAYTDAMTRDIHVSADLYARVSSAFTAEQVVDLTVTIGAYNMVSRILCALEIE